LKALVESKRCNAVIIAALDQIAWLLNLRGGDISYNPVFLAYLVAVYEGEPKVQLYSDPEKFRDPAVQEHLKQLHVALVPYSQLIPDLRLMQDKTVAIELDSMNAKVIQTVKAKSNPVIDLADSIPALKARPSFDL
jgi:Xaa-Pro aminopeptidase